MSHQPGLETFGYAHSGTRILTGKTFSEVYFTVRCTLCFALLRERVERTDLPWFQWCRPDWEECAVADQKRPRPRPKPEP